MFSLSTNHFLFWRSLPWDDNSVFSIKAIPSFAQKRPAHQPRNRFQLKLQAKMELFPRIDTLADGKLDFKLYRYTPSFPAAIVATVIFAILSCLHIWRLSKARAWYFIPFTIGGACTSPRFMLTDEYS
jgi:hypothetical protein